MTTSAPDQSLEVASNVVDFVKVKAVKNDEVANEPIYNFELEIVGKLSSNDIQLITKTLCELGFDTDCFNSNPLGSKPFTAIHGISHNPFVRPLSFVDVFKKVAKL